ncbi:GYD family protein [Shinella sp. SUS2]|uniref:GYD domain-containing protein n=1 Tax=unclassified Shinella TaxID=2643062 RepID=UPI00067FD272|nr:MULTISPECIES: GYD domain-containing protein [unclassified Shinella]KNY15099.1 GYD family protein [Shinella sp. SUS2]KOC72398.1 GYD family protein [Shinella sp. GWS1]
MSEVHASQKYVSLMRLTQKGLTELTDSAKRRKVSEDRVAALGGRSIAFYALLGPYDFVQIFEMPSNEAMMQYVLTARRDGHVEPLILPAFDTDTYGQILTEIV